MPAAEKLSFSACSPPPTVGGDGGGLGVWPPSLPPQPGGEAAAGSSPINSESEGYPRYKRMRLYRQTDISYAKYVTTKMETINKPCFESKLASGVTGAKREVGCSDASNLSSNEITYIPRASALWELPT